MLYGALYEEVWLWRYYDGSNFFNFLMTLVEFALVSENGRKKFCLWWVVEIHPLLWMPGVGVWKSTPLKVQSGLELAYTILLICGWA